MQDLNDLYYFVQTVEHRGFAPAGRALGMPKSKLSRRVAMLEERLGVRLIQRSTRHFLVTDIGQSYYERCKAMLAEAEAAQEVIDAAQVEPRGVVRLSCPVALLHVYVGDMLAEFMRRYPRVVVQLESTNRRVDVLAEGVDIAIRVRPPPLEDSDLVKAHGMPGAPEDLLQWPHLALGIPNQPLRWQLLGPQERQATVPLTPRLITTDMIALRDAALAGVGVVQLPRLMVREQIAGGQLVQVLPGWEPRREIVHAVFPSRRGLLSSVRALVDFLAERFAALDAD
ncbi:LysR family transcriptional regulator [Bordetella hinzii]|uniref:LysR substrate-binding domain-containing protein n=1 Tax=Bordetella hinzii TaxID=103855 RepID=UPI0004000438|nr:LysR substrate-binding domain-containing protein [Bordetella hinzii]AKQ56351.1 HTH-type transcriptional regulator DmlR [Bordetella hinzii]KCB33493.1 LysR substrate-binding domain protein [Bordetella hinzii L60]SNV75303.1 LysR family transcriptional regulator [Bordetella hinzii]